MNYLLNNLAQGLFDLSISLTYSSSHARGSKKFLARLAKKAVKFSLKAFKKNHVVHAKLFGYSLAMPIVHPLPLVLAELPQYNRPLGLAIDAIAEKYSNEHTVGVIDVGANIGDTIAIIEQRHPGFCSYLCIEADKELARLCRINHAGNPKVWIKQNFIGEKEGTTVWLQDDGCANPSTKVSIPSHKNDNLSGDKLIRLDTAAREFRESVATVRLIKVDTEGYDFSVLRSAADLITQDKPAIYFEWYPRLLTNLDETVWGGFQFLANLGYRYFVFFTNKGDYYCRICDPDLLLLRSLSSLALSEATLGYFDVFASTEQDICDAIVEASITLLDHKHIDSNKHTS